MFIREMKKAEATESPEELKCYDLPWISEWLRRQWCCTFVPCLPSYISRPFNCCKCCKCCQKEDGVSDGGRDNSDIVSDEVDEIHYIGDAYSSGKYTSDALTTKL